VAPERVLQVSRELARWGSWMKERRPRPKLEEVDADLLVRYIRDRNAFRAKATLSSNISTMRGMGEFLVRQQIWTSNPLRWIRGPRRDARSLLPKRLEPKQMHRLWQGAASLRARYQRHLWITILSLFYGTGIRRGELSRLDLEDWDGEAGLLLIDGRKTGQERRVPVPELAWRVLASYLPVRHNQLERTGCLGERALLVNKDGGRLTGAAIGRGAHRIARRMKVPLSSVHQFRHTCASDLLEAGMTLPEVKELLGHQVIETTLRYVHIADRQRHEAVQKHPVNDLLCDRPAEEVTT
jgi:site-specific recombinase XerD